MRLFLIGLAAFLVSCMQGPYPYHGHGNYGPPPVSQPAPPYGQPPVAQPPYGQPPVAQPPYGQPPVRPIPQPPVNQPGDRICGGLTGATCGFSGEFCYLTVQAQCGAADQTGVCRPIPQVCTQEYAPVCGCDGRTYSNECTANGNGVSAAYRGPCRN